MRLTYEAHGGNMSRESLSSFHSVYIKKLVLIYRARDLIKKFSEVYVNRVQFVELRKAN